MQESIAIVAGHGSPVRRSSIASSRLLFAADTHPLTKKELSRETRASGFIQKDAVGVVKISVASFGDKDPSEARVLRISMSPASERKEKESLLLIRNDENRVVSMIWNGRFGHSRLLKRALPEELRDYSKTIRLFKDALGNREN